MISSADRPDKILTNPAFIVLRMTETYMMLSPGLSPIIGRKRARMFGDKRDSMPPPFTTTTTGHLSLGPSLPKLGAGLSLINSVTLGT